MVKKNKKVKGMVLTGIESMEMQEFPRPVIGDADALMKVEMVAVCGTDHAMYRGRHKVKFPILMGHEILGRIEEIGAEKSASTGIKAGDRVVVETRFGCGKCRSCIRGEYTKCEKKYGYGQGITCTTPPYLWGAYAEYLYIPERAILHKISEEVPAEAGVMTCAVLGNSVRWLSHAGGCKLGDTVVILGCGRQGLGLVVAAREAGASKIIITGTRHSYQKLELAKELGADEVIVVDEENTVERVREITDGEMADIVIDVSGHISSAAITADLTKNYGTVVLPGLYDGRTTPIDFDKVTMKELTIKGVHTHDMKSVEAAIKIIESRRYPLEKMVTHHYPLEQAEYAVRVAAGMVEGEQPINVVIVPNAD